MFSPSVVNLRQFYATPFGESVRSLIARRLSVLWPESASDTALGIGFAMPYMSGYLARRAPAIVCMPAAQGAVYWPPEQDNVVFLAYESELPLPENSVNRVILMHSVEHSEQLSGLMSEVWRVLTPGGRVMMVVPNRLSFWARSERSPFGYGQPFTATQARALLTEHNFTLMRSASALFAPPLYWNWLWRIAPKIEAVGNFLCPPLGGVLFIEAEKQLYAAIKQPAMARKKYRAAIVPAKAGV